MQRKYAGGTFDEPICLDDSDDDSQATRSQSPPPAPPKPAAASATVPQPQPQPTCAPAPPASNRSSALSHFLQQSKQAYSASLASSSAGPSRTAAPPTVDSEGGNVEDKGKGKDKGAESATSTTPPSAPAPAASSATTAAVTPPSNPSQSAQPAPPPPAQPAQPSRPEATSPPSSAPKPSPGLAAFIAGSKRAYNALGEGSSAPTSTPASKEAEAAAAPSRKKSRSAAVSHAVTPLSSSPAPGTANLGRTRSAQSPHSVYDGLLHPFKPPPQPTAPLTIDDMIRESHRRFQPNGLRCPLLIGDEMCGARLTTGQILMMHISKHVEKLRADPKKVYWFDQDGITSDPLNADELEKCAPARIEAIERSRCIFAGCKAEFRNAGYGRTAHFGSEHPPPYSYDQLRKLNAIIRPPPSTRVLPELPKEIPTWQLVTPIVRARPRSAELASLETPNPILEERDPDDPFVPSTWDRMIWAGGLPEDNSSNFLYYPKRKADDAMPEDDDEMPASQMTQLPPTPVRGGRVRPNRAIGSDGLTTQTIEVSHAHPNLTRANWVRTPFTVRKNDTPLRINIRPTGPDVILHKCRTLAAEAMRERGEVPPPVEPVGTEAFLIENGFTSRVEAPAASQGKSTSAPVSIASPSSSVPPAPSASASVPPPSGTTTPTAPTPAQVKRKTQAQLKAEYIAGLKAEAARNREIETAASQYAFMKTGERIGFEFYKHQQAAIMHQKTLDRENKPKAEPGIVSA